MKTHAWLWCCAAVVATGSACGPAYGRRVPNDLLVKLPYETRIELLEAENDLAAAVDKVDTAASEIDRMRAGLRRAKDRLSAAEREVGEATDAPSREVAELAVAEARARVEALRARQRLNVEQESVEQLGLRCAHARFERARLEVARKAKVQGSESLRPEDFDAQVKACEEDWANRRQALTPVLAEVEKAKGEWNASREALARKTFDARASPYVE